MQRKIFTILMVICMIFTYMPSVAFADGVIDEDENNVELTLDAEEVPEDTSEEVVSEPASETVEDQETEGENVEAQPSKEETKEVKTTKEDTKEVKASEEEESEDLTDEEDIDDAEMTLAADNKIISSVKDIKKIKFETGRTYQSNNLSNAGNTTVRKITHINGISIKKIENANNEDLEIESYLYCMDPGVNPPTESIEHTVDIYITNEGRSPAKDANGNALSDDEQKKYLRLRKLMYYSYGNNGYSKKGGTKTKWYQNYTESGGTTHMYFMSHNMLAHAYSTIKKIEDDTENGRTDLFYRNDSFNDSAHHQPKKDMNWMIKWWGYYPTSESRGITAPSDFSFSTYKLANLPDPPENFGVFITQEEGKQDLIGSVYIPETDVTIKKTTDKQELEGKYPIKDVKFTIYEADGKTVATSQNNKKAENLTLNSDYETKSVPLDPGTYVIKEVAHPKYFKDVEPKTKELKDGDSETVTFKNYYVTPPVALTKTPSKEPPARSSEFYSLQGAQYWVYDTKAHAEAAVAAAKAGSSIPTAGRVKDASGNNIEFSTNASGKTSSVEVDLGDYWAAEIKASKGYQLDDTARHVEVTPDHTSSNPAMFQSVEKPTPGYLKLHKTEPKPHYSHPENYSLVGAQYQVYEDAACTKPATDFNGKSAVLTTQDENGNTNVLEMWYGDYWIKETVPSKGHYLDPTVYPVQIRDGNTQDKPVSVESEDGSHTGHVYLEKSAAKTDVDYLKEAPNNYTLGGAEYDVFVASGPNKDKLAKDIDGKEFTLKTTYDSAKKLGITNKVEVDVGDYYAKEKVAPKGYIITPREKEKDSEVDVTKENDINHPAKFEVENPPTYKSPEIKLFKYDPEGVQGWEKLLGAYYQVSYYDITCPYGDADNPAPDSITYTKPTRKWIFKTREVDLDVSAQTGGTVRFAGWDWDTDTLVSSVTLDGPVTTAGGERYKAGDVIKSDPLYIEGGKRILPIGFYTIEEIKAPTGIARNPLVVHGKIYQPAMGEAALDVKDRKMVQVQYPENEQDVTIAIQKKDKETGKNEAQGQLSNERLKSPGSLKGAVYNVYFNNDETEVPEIVGTLTTDENGYAELTKRTKGRKQALAMNEALEPGNYYIEEVQASDGYVIDKYVLDGETTIEEVKHEIEVICDYDEDGNPVKKTIGGTYDVDEIDANVDFTGDIDNEVAVKGKLGSRHVFHARVEARNTNLFKFTAESLEGPHDTEVFKTDITTGELLEGATLQVLDSKGDIIEQWVSTKEPHSIKCLYDETQGELKDGKYTLREISAPYGYDIAEDVQFEVKSNQIYNKVEMKNKPIEIGTIATDAETKAHQGTFKKEERLVDKVKITGLYAGRTYKASGVLMDKATGQPLLDASGAEISAESEPFVATGDEMEAEVVFIIDSSEFTTDKVLVAFEKLYRVERFREEKSDFPGEEFPKELQKHEDINDEEQSIHYGGIVSTHASDKASKSHNILAAKDVTIVDVVKYENLSPNEEYLLKGQLFDKTTGELLAVSAERPFTPETPDGEVEMEFTFDASGFENHDLVVFEELYINGVFINDHKNPDDEEQTMHVPEIRTTATDVETEDHIAYGSELVTIKDLVMYYNLIPGNEYTMKGTLMNKETGEPIESNGEPVTAEAKFTPTEKDGSVELTFTFDGTDLLGTTTVAFEECDINDAAVAIHADLNDEEQSVNIPEIGTKAALVKKTVEDTVEYKNLMPGRYVMRGWLVNHKNGKKLRDSDGEFEFEVTENHASGEVVVELPINGYNKLGGYSLTAFEELYYQKVITDEEGNETIEEYLVADHTDRNDKKQTIKIPNIKTGDTNAIYMYGGLFAILVAAGAVYVIRRRKNK